ncbi:MAG TPA: PRD domain-containing protein [Clostridia bacterium]|nr:PRD domain-containing protein [Clostridia bacterium]
MDQTLRERLDILKEAGEISDGVREAVMEFAESFENKYSLTMTEENASMLITHLAMALARIQKNEEIGGMDESAMEEIRQSSIYSELPEFYKRLEDKLDIKLPESEKGYIALHACAIVVKLQNEGGV